MNKEELEKEADNFIIDRYKLNECYREDNAETREYMRMDVHSQYEEEYQLYLAVAEPREKRIAELKKENKKAKEIIKKFSEFANLEVEYDPEHPQEHTDLWNELCKEAEAFINKE